MRSLFALAALVVATMPAQAHFLWLLPSKVEGKPQVRMVFSDQLAPDDEALLARIKQAKVFTVDASGELADATFAQEKDAFVVALPEDARLVGANCTFGVFQRGENPPMLLNYHAIALLGGAGADMEKLTKAAANRLELNVRPAAGAARPTIVVTWKDKPVADAEVVFTIPGKDKPVTLKTGEDGTVALQMPEKSGVYGIRARHILANEGEYQGKKYKEERHYVTMTFPVREGALGRTPGKARAVTDQPEVQVVEDKEASQLLAEARGARANWTNFPGFSADLEINVDGKVTRGQVAVDAKGKVTLSGIGNPALESETVRELRSLVGHRLDNSSDLNTPCAFPDNDTTHPLGRTVQVLNDEFHSSYRIRDRQIIVVNRKMKDARFTITVMENTVNAEKQFLPSCYVVNTWNLESETLRSSQTFHHQWTRQGKFDLPTSVLVVTANSEGKLTSRRLTLSNHKLN